MRYTALATKRFGGWGGIVLAAIVCVAIGSTPALAKPKPAGKRIAVLPPTDGSAKDAVISAKIATALKQHKIQAIGGGPVKRALGTSGVPSSDSDWIDLARKLKVDGVVEPAISGSGAKRRVEVVVHNGADGSVAGRQAFSAKGPPAKLAAAVAAGLWKKLGSAIQETTPPKKDKGGFKPVEQSSPPPEPVASADKPEEKPAKAALPKDEAEQPGEAESEESERAPPARTVKASPGKNKPSGELRTVEVEVGGRALQRLFEYTPSSAGAAHTEHFLPVIEVRAAWFPINYAGIFVSGEYNPSLKSNTTPSFPTGTRELILGAQGRYPLSFGQLGFSAAYFQHVFVFGDTSDPNDEPRRDLVWPDVAYQGGRFAASARFYLWDIVQVGAEAGYRLVTSPGEGGMRVRSASYFPKGSASYGLDGSAFVSVGVLPWLEIRGGVDYRRYAFGALAPGPDNAKGTNATGATDQYLGFTLGAVGVYGGK
jgi:hypothetical protein